VGPATGEHQRTLTGTQLGLCVAVQPGRALPGSGSGDDTVRLWDPATGEHQRTLTGHGVAFVSAVAFSRTGGCWPAQQGQEVRCGPATGEHQRTLTATATGSLRWRSADGGCWPAAAADDTVGCGTRHREHQRTLTGHRNWVSAVAFSPDGRLLASCGSA